ncbi:MAG: phosphatidate cytidylyltransferase [Gammaproteobacteria bacterium]
MKFEIPSNVQVALLAILGGLLIASLVVVLMDRARPERDYSELKLRVRTWWYIILVFCAAIAFNRIVSVCVFGVISFLAFKEYLSLIPTRRADHRVLFWAYLAIPIQYYWVGIAWYGMFIIFIPVYAFLFLAMRMVLIGETRGFLHAAGTLHWGLMTTVFSLSHMAYLQALPEQGNPHGGGDALVLFLVLLTETNDISQYISGKTLGRHKVIPKVSPKKTVEGLLGGIATTVLLSWMLAPLLTPLSTLESIVSGVIISLFGFVGDVTVSAVKRDIGVKDSGSMLPGHGGVLDRLDSLTYTAPLFLHFIRYLHY